MKSTIKNLLRATTFTFTVCVGSTATAVDSQEFSVDLTASADSQCGYTTNLVGDSDFNASATYNYATGEMVFQSTVVDPPYLVITTSSSTTECADLSNIAITATDPTNATPVGTGTTFYLPAEDQTKQYGWRFQPVVARVQYFDSSDQQIDAAGDTININDAAGGEHISTNTAAQSLSTIEESNDFPLGAVYIGKNYLSSGPAPLFRGNVSAGPGTGRINFSSFPPGTVVSKVNLSVGLLLSKYPENSSGDRATYNISTAGPADSFSTKFTLNVSRF